MTPDHLGTPRAISDASGAVSRHDYKPFGEEIGEADNRTAALGYGTADGVRQKFTSKERDSESGLDYFGARYFASGHGRFTSPDPVLMRDARLVDPQRINLYAHTRNSPLRYVDPSGEDILVIENGPTEGNPVGHTAVAVSGYGVFSLGNGTALGSSTSDYILRESPRRDTTLYIIQTSAEEDRAVVEMLLKQDEEKGSIGRYPDNCSGRSNSALDAIGVPPAVGAPSMTIGVPMGGPSEFPSAMPVPQLEYKDPSLPGTAGARAAQLPKEKVTVITVPKGSTTIPEAVKPFDPLSPHPDPRLPRTENKKPGEPEPSS